MKCEKKCTKKCVSKKDLWGWWESKDRTFTVTEIKCLMERIKEFNAGCIDKQLTAHVDKVFAEWAKAIEN